MEKILVAEDDAVTARMIERILGELSYPCEIHRDGDAAWKAFDNTPTRIVLSDWIMPGLDGLEFCNAIRKRPKTAYTYFILISATRNSPDDYRKAVQFGVDDFLHKPLDPDRVWARLHVAHRILSYTTQIGEMGRLIPICSYCKKIRNDDTYWQQVESYIQQKTGSSFSHGICPDCYRQIMEKEGLEESDPHSLLPDDVQLAD